MRKVNSENDLMLRQQQLAQQQKQQQQQQQASTWNRPSISNSSNASNLLASAAATNAPLDVGTSGSGKFETSATTLLKKSSRKPTRSQSKSSLMDVAKLTQAKLDMLRPSSSISMQTVASSKIRKTRASTKRTPPITPLVRVGPPRSLKRNVSLRFHN
jgi:transcription initiation factor TFIID subunit TAF12